MAEFVHLHVHSHYSIGRALPRVRDLVQRASDLEMPAIALTDNNSIAGMGELVREAEESNVQPILGCELDILPSSHGLYQGRTHRLTLLVESEAGYRNLVALITCAHNRVGDQPVHVTFSEFMRHSKGLIVLTGSPRSELYAWLRESKTAETKAYLNRLVSEIGRENLFFEVTEYPHPRIRRIMDYILELSRFLHLPAVATQNVHFLDPEDMPAYCALVQHPHQLSPKWPLPNEELPTRHFATAQEMSKRFAYTPEILEETLLVAQRCKFTFPSHRALIPVPEFERGQDPASVLWDKAVRGAQLRYGTLSAATKERLNAEYGDIRNTEGGRVDLTEYLLLLHEIASFIRESSLCRGVGSGRLTSSVIAYALGIVEADPLAYEIEYEPLRLSPGCYPRFEIEASTHAMERVVKWLTERYGERHLALVGRWVEWPRGRLFQHLCRWAGLPETNLRQFRPDRLLAPEPEPEISSDDVPRDYAAVDLSARSDDEIETGATGGGTSHLPPLGDGRIPRNVSLRQHRTLADAVYRMHPCLRELEAERTHYVVSREPLNDSIPVMPGASGQQITQGNAGLLDQLHMLRIEFSSLPLLNVLESALGWIRQESSPAFSLNDIPLDDEQTFRLLSLGLTNGITPLHSITTKSFLRSENPRSIADLIQVHGRAARQHGGEGTRGRAASLPDCVLSYWCAYMKVHHPVPFMAAMLTHSVSSHSAAAQRPRFQILLRETRKMGIEILGPHINFSTYEFSQEGRKIRTGLTVVRGLGRQTFDEIAQVRHSLPFSGLSDFCQRTDPRRVPYPLIVNLIKAGAFDGLGEHRGRLLVDFERALKNARLHAPGSSKSSAGAGPKRGLPGAHVQLQLFDSSMFDDEPPPPREETHAPPPPLSQREVMRYEQEAVGYSISFDLFDYYEELIRSMRTITPFEVNVKMEGKTIHVAGFVDHIEREGPLIVEGTEMVLDLEGHVVKVPPRTTGDLTHLLNSRSPVLIEGIVRRLVRNECYLEARSIHLLDEVARKAEEVRTLRLNLAGESSRTLARIRSVIRAYRGNSQVEVENDTGLSWWTARGIHGAKVFYCPPLYQGLQEVLAKNRMKILDRAGRPVAN